MEINQILATGGASATMIAIAGLIYKIIQGVCNKRLRSECCDHQGSIGVAVEEMPKREPRASVEVKIHPSPIITSAPEPVAPPPLAL